MTVTLTMRQKDFLDSLLDERVSGDAEKSNWRWHLSHAQSRSDLDRGFKVLFSMPKLGSSTTSYSKVDELGKRLPEGDTHYALQNAEGGWRFYSVSRPIEGKWVGRTFVKVEAGDSTYPLQPEQRLEVIEQILADVESALANYGKQLGHCGICGRKLTNEESRKYGIGPYCRGKL